MVAFSLIKVLYKDSIFHVNEGKVIIFLDSCGNYELTLAVSEMYPTMSLKFQSWLMSHSYILHTGIFWCIPDVFPCVPDVFCCIPEVFCCRTVIT